MKVTLSDEGLITFEDGDSLNRNTLNRKRLVAVPETALAAGESLWVQFGDNIDYDAAASEILEPIMLEYAEEYGGYITLLPDAVLRKPGKWYMTLAVRLYAADGTTYQSQLTSEKTSFTVNDSYPLEDGGYASNATLQNLYNETVAAKEGAETAQTAAETAQTAAETAQTAAEAAQAAAETAQTGAETAETNAQTAEQGAQAAQTAAETARTGAESAQGSAEAAQTAAENAANAASGSAGQAADSAAAAQSSASAASASATAAQGYMEQAKEYAQKEYKLYDSFSDLPVPGDSAFIYLVPQSGSEEHDNYAEYLWISESGAYEFIGTVNDIDLSNYAQQNGTYPGMTVGNATNAENASHAATADSATSATNATNATHAESADSANDPSAVHFTEQTLTSEQQEQARTNIGAASEEELVAGLAEKQPTGNYALQDGTYAGMTVGNATNAGNDGEGNSIYDSYLGWWNIGTLKGNKATSQDFNDYTATGCYEILGSADSPAVNNPVSTSNPSSSDCNWYFLVFTRTGENFITQIAFSTREDNAVAIRSMSNAEWGSWRLISEEGSAPTADKVANALTIKNITTGMGNILLYNGSSALTIDLAPQTTNVYAEITAANMFAYVYAHIVMQRRGYKADIHMDFRIDLRSGNPTSDWTLFTTARLADVLGLSSLSFESNNTRVMIENCPSSTFGTVGGVYAGYTGFVLAFDGSKSGGIGIGRFYNQPSNDSVGAWEVTTEEVYSEDYIYHADIWGADVS